MSAQTSHEIRIWRRMPKTLRRRIAVLAICNLGILGFIAWCASKGESSSLGAEFSQMMPNVAPTILAGLGLTGIVCCGAIDLSIGSILAVAGALFGVLHARGFDPRVCFTACFLTASVLSTWNGVLIELLGLPAIIVTLAGIAFYRGVALILADASAIGFGEQFTLNGDAYHTPGRENAGAILLVVVVAGLVWEFFGKTPRTWLALGNSEMACRLGGLRPGRILLQAFVVGGIFLGLATLIEVTNHITVEPARLGLGFELTVIAAVVLGGTSIFGGQGSYLGTALGGLFLYLLGPAMMYAGVNEYWRTAVQGGTILIVIGTDCFLGRKRKYLEELR